MNRLFRTSAILLTLCLIACGSKENTGGEDKNELKAPTGVNLTGKTSNTASFEWNGVEGAENYVWRIMEGSVQLQTETTRSTSITVGNLSKGKNYGFAVRAMKGVSLSPWSETVNFTILDSQQVDDAVYAEFLIPNSEEDKIARAFPGAEGGGMYTTGGRGGKVIHVTTLEDDAQGKTAGSLRAALYQSGARTIVFDVAGRIELKAKLSISNGDVTIAGQTAPGDGICISGYPITLNSNNIIIRFIRFRLGDTYATDDSFDTIWGRYHDNIIIDHCSMCWSIDECCSFYANGNFTLQWCLVAESLNSSGKHSKPNHGYGGIWGGKNASFHHNMLAHHNNRTPRFDHPEIYDAASLASRRGNVDYRNNVVFNWGNGNGCYGGNGSYINMVGNYYKPGPASSDRHYFIQADGHYNAGSSSNPDWHTYQYPYLYMTGNIHTKYSDISSDNSKGVNWSSATNASNGDVISRDGHLLSLPLEIVGKDGQKAYTTTHTANDAFAKVCTYAGAVGTSLKRDAVDERIAGEAESGTVTYASGGNGSTGGIIDTQTAVGGWPEYKCTESEKTNQATDTDKDGIPDWFEDRFGLDKNNSSDASVKWLDKNGRYTNFEMYLHYLVREVVKGQNSNGAYSAL